MRGETATSTTIITYASIRNVPPITYKITNKGTHIRKNGRWWNHSSSHRPRNAFRATHWCYTHSRLWHGPRCQHLPYDTWLHPRLDPWTLRSLYLLRSTRTGCYRSHLVKSRARYLQRQGADWRWCRLRHHALLEARASI